MSRSARSGLADHRNPITTVSVALQIAIVILITQRVDSSSYDRSDDNSIPKDDKKASGFKFRTDDFEVSFDVFHTKNEHKELKPLKSIEDRINKAIQDGTFYPPNEIPDKINPPNDRVRPRLGDGSDPEMFKPTIPEECENKLICDKDLSYPEEAVAEVVKDLNDLRVLAIVDSDPIGNRIAEDGSQNLCESDQMTWYPKSVRKSRSDPWHRVVNVKNFRQGFRVVHCQKMDASCSGSFDIVEAGQAAVCKQQYSYRQLAVFNPNNGTAFANIFPFPSGCCCHRKSTDGTSARMSRNTRYSVHSHYPWLDNEYRGHRWRNN